MPRIIKLTKKQLREADDGNFDYIDDNNDMPSSNCQTQISVDGKLDNDRSGNPLISDRIAKSITAQTYSRFNNYANNCRHGVREGVDINDDNIDDFYNNDELDILSNGDDNDNLVKVPQGVDYKTDMLVNSMTNLNPKQQAIVLNKILENIDLNSIPYRWKKELIMKMLSNNNSN